ncbi:MAG: GGDEF domain-containing response regulator [Actinomycetota bacterium]
MTVSGRTLILVADDDADIVRFVEVNLRLEGFDVATAFDGEQALHAAIEMLPDLIILDVMMPRLDGLEVCRRLRNEGRTKNISIIMLTAKSLPAEKVAGLTAGADDYIIKPFDPLELVARVKSALRRARDMRAINPLTQLPGNVQVQEEVVARVGSGTPFALIYIDLDNFKAFNDFYGFLRGDEAIKALARCVTEAVQRHQEHERFVGHVGGDDFIAIVDPSVAETVAKDTIARWDLEVRSLYDPEDLERGYIEVLDRQKHSHRYAVMTVSIGVASNAHRPIDSHWEASEIATEMKHYAKRDEKSAYAIDRRRSGEQQGYDSGR